MFIASRRSACHTHPSRGRLVLILCFSTWATAGLAGTVAECAWCRTADGAEPATSPAALPGPPAFHTVAISRIRNIGGDYFDFERDDRSLVRVRLFDADCSAMGDSAAANATAIVTPILETEPVWVFPVGQTKSAGRDEFWALVWTSRGWLSDLIVRAGYSRRRTDFSGISLEPASAPVGASAKAPQPSAPAFASAICTAIEGDLLEVNQNGEKVRVRLFDVSCQDLDASQREAARAEATRIVGAGGVWVFPCSQRRLQAELPVRIWTQAGWLSEGLVNARLARRLADPDKAAALASRDKTSPPPTVKDGPQPRTRPGKEPRPGEAKIIWHEIALERATGGDATGLTPMSWETKVFNLTTGIWRITWNLKPVRQGGHVVMNIYRVDDKWEARISSTLVSSFQGPAGVEVHRSQPGRYWIRVTGSVDKNIKMEEGEVVTSP